MKIKINLTKSTKLECSQICCVEHKFDGNPILIAKIPFAKYYLENEHSCYPFVARRKPPKVIHNQPEIACCDAKKKLV